MCIEENFKLYKIYIDIRSARSHMPKNECILIIIIIINIVCLINNNNNNNNNKHNNHYK